MSLYNELNFAIDLIVNEYKTKDPEFIQRKLLETMGMNVRTGQILDYFNYQMEDYEKESTKIEFSTIFENL
jgi:hypothetical protein